MRVVAEVVNATRIAYGRKRRRQGAPLPALSRSRGRRRLSQEVRRDRREGYEGFVFASESQSRTINRIAAQ